MPEVWVVNASPVILLAKVGRLDLFERLGATPLVPETVLRELSTDTEGNPEASELLNWATTRRAADVPVPLSIERWDLGPGESQVIAHCLIGAQRAVLDDAQGRECARAHTVPVIGTLGVVLHAKQRGLIPAARPWVDRLREVGLFLDDDLAKRALARVGE